MEPYNIFVILKILNSSHARAKTFSPQEEITSQFYISICYIVLGEVLFLQT